MWDELSSTWREGVHAVTSLEGEAWYAAPTLIEPASPNFRPLDLAMTLHNARKGSGRAEPHAVAMRSVNTFLGMPDAPLETYKSGLMKEVEELLEEVRKGVAPDAPSRMACYFVSADFETAKRRMNDFRTGRNLYPCRVLLDGPIHIADIGLFDRVTNTLNRKDAEAYWMSAKNVGPYNENSDLEILVGGSLYFPDWMSFPELDYNKIAYWMSFRQMCLDNNWSLTGWQRGDASDQSNEG
jgi:hypothetical protein